MQRMVKFRLDPTEIVQPNEEVVVLFDHIPQQVQVLRAVVGTHCEQP
jgi:hypothetical protein